MATARELQAASDKMKQYVDPRTGTISFSGADMTAVIFLPMSTEQLDLHIKKKKAELEIAFQVVFGLEDIMDPATRYRIRDEHVSLFREVDRLEKLRKEGARYTHPVELLDLQTLSISSHREKFPVRTLGRVHPKSYTRGPRTIAGSLIFTLFNKAALFDLLQATGNFYSTGVAVPGSNSAYPELTTVLADQIPPFDITIMCSNELGDNSYLVLYGVEIVNDGQTLSIQDIITENVMQFVARDFEPMRPLAHRNQLLELGESVITSSNRLEELKTERERRGVRLNPFV